MKCLLATLVASFNLVDSSKDIVVYRGPDNSDFGYAIALYKNNYTGSNVIVGAPKANTSEFLREDIISGGALFKCSTGKNFLTAFYSHFVLAKKGFH